MNTNLFVLYGIKATVPFRKKQQLKESFETIVVKQVKTKREIKATIVESLRHDSMYYQRYKHNLQFKSIFLIKRKI